MSFVLCNVNTGGLRWVTIHLLSVCLYDNKRQSSSHFFILTISSSVMLGHRPKIRWEEWTYLLLFEMLSCWRQTTAKQTQISRQDVSLEVMIVSVTVWGAGKFQSAYWFPCVCTKAPQKVYMPSSNNSNESQKIILNETKQMQNVSTNSTNFWKRPNW